MHKKIRIFNDNTIFSLFSVVIGCCSRDGLDTNSLLHWRRKGSLEAPVVVVFSLHAKYNHTFALILSGE